MEKRGPVREYHAGGPFGIVSDQPSILLAKSQGRSQYVVHFRDDGRLQFRRSSSSLGKRMPVAGFLWKLDIKVKFLSQFPHLCGWTTFNRVVKITRTSSFMHYLLCYDISSVQETEKTAELLLTSKKWRLQSGCNHSTAYVDQWKG